jgi:hypothetical protein
MGFEVCIYLIISFELTHGLWKISEASAFWNVESFERSHIEPSIISGPGDPFSPCLSVANWDNTSDHLGRTIESLYIPYFSYEILEFGLGIWGFNAEPCMFMVEG